MEAFKVRCFPEGVLASSPSRMQPCNCSLAEGIGSGVGFGACVLCGWRSLHRRSVYFPFHPHPRSCALRPPLALALDRTLTHSPALSSASSLVSESLSILKMGFHYGLALVPVSERISTLSFAPESSENPGGLQIPPDGPREPWKPIQYYMLRSSRGAFGLALTALPALRPSQGPSASPRHLHFSHSAFPWAPLASYDPHLTSVVPSPPPLPLASLLPLFLPRGAPAPSLLEVSVSHPLAS